MGTNFIDVPLDTPLSGKDKITVYTCSSFSQQTTPHVAQHAYERRFFGGWFIPTTTTTTTSGSNPGNNTSNSTAYYLPVTIPGNQKYRSESLAWCQYLCTMEG